MEATATLPINETVNETVETVLSEIELNNGKPYEFAKHLEGYLPLTQAEIDAYTQSNPPARNYKRFGRHFTTPVKRFETIRDTYE